MATQEEKISAIQHILKAEYNSTRWKTFLSRLFTSSTFFSNPTELVGINEAVASKAQHIGNIKVNVKNDTSSTIAVYEVKLAENVVLERNRVGLRNLLKPHWKQQVAAFIVYYHPQAKSWRFSYVSELGEFTDTGYVTSSTEPKRYTYVLGENESCRTAAIQFSKLQDKTSNATLDDIKEAFSVEKMSKEFFDKYKNHYQDFVQFLTGKRLEKVAGKWEEVVKKEPDTQLITIFNNNEKDVRDFCKKLLGRIVFLYFIQKKGWLGVPLHDKWGNGKPDFISRLLANCRNPSIFYSEYLSKLFFETLNQPRPDDLAEIIPGEKTRVPYLNGGLFEEDDPNQRCLIFEEKLFKDLFAFFDQYNFTIYEDDPNDHTVAVDPEMLGHIFENLLEDNKDKGAFYTPKEIVHYMCQESLIEYLTTWFEGKNYQVQQDTFISFDNSQQASFLSANEGRTGQGVLEIAQSAKPTGKIINRSLIEKLLKKQLSDEDTQAVIEHAAEFNEALDKVKICDPAIGSGAFPMGLLLEIFTAKQTIHTFTNGDLTTFEPAKVKLNIIQNSIYGVDIERGAVDIARLRFWLSLVVDEPEPQPLPNLDYKIVVGNSLISKLGDDVIEIDWDVKKNTTFDIFGEQETKSIQNILKQLTQLQKEFFDPSSRKKNQAIQIRDLKIDLLIEQLNLMIESQGLKQPPHKTATLSQKNFVAQTERFMQTESWKQQIQHLKLLKTKPDEPLEYFDWQLNFAEVMNKEIIGDKPAGFDIVIGNPPYVFSRENLTEEDKHIYNQRFNLTQFKINLYILFIEKGYSLMSTSGVFSYITPNNWLTLDTNSDLREFILRNASNIKILQNYANVFESANVDTAILGFKKQGSNQVEYMEWVNKKPTLINIKSKAEYLAKSSFLFSNHNSDFNNSYMEKIKGLELHQICDVKNGVQAYTVGEGSPICTEHIKNNREYHSLTKYDEHWLKYLDGVDVCRYSMGWSGQYIKYGRNLSRPRRFELFNGERILVRQIPSPLPSCINASYINELAINDNNSMIVKINNPEFKIKYILGLLNSRLLSKWFADYFGKLSRKLFPQFKINELRIFPIAPANSIVQDVIDSLVEKIYENKLNSMDTQELELEIDLIVYKLYNLTLDEVKQIDPNFTLSEDAYNAIVI